MGEDPLDERVAGREEIEPLVRDGLLAVEGPEEAGVARHARQAVDERAGAELDRVRAAGVRLDVQRQPLARTR